MFVLVVVLCLGLYCDSQCIPFHLVLSLILPFSRYMLCDSVRSVFAHVRFFQNSDLVWAGEQSQLPPPSNPAYRARIPTLPSIWSSASLIYQRLYRDTTPRNNNILSIWWVFAGYIFCWKSLELNVFLNYWLEISPEIIPEIIPEMVVGIPEIIPGMIPEMIVGIPEMIVGIGTLPYFHRLCPVAAGRTTATHSNDRKLKI